MTTIFAPRWERQRPTDTEQPPRAFADLLAALLMSLDADVRSDVLRIVSAGELTDASPLAIEAAAS